MDYKEAQRLLKEYADGTCTPEERERVEAWYNRVARQATDMPPIHDHAALQALHWELFTQLDKKKQKPLLRNLYKAAAVILFGMLAIAFYFYAVQPDTPNTLVQTQSDIDVSPGSNQATLTLSNGRKIALSTQREAIMVKGNTIAYNDGEPLVHSKRYPGKIGDGLNEEREQETLLLSTPAGGQYQVILPDGSKVWLNARSSLKYPLRFSSESRKITLSGEAYLEVNNKIGRNGSHPLPPFIVISKGQEVKVLGTSFNLNAYDDEKTVKTTLLEGSLQVISSNGQRFQLLPNEQTSLQGNRITKKTVETEAEISWKNGLFQFNESTIQDIMLQLSRWYNVEVSYSGMVPDIFYTGIIRRDSKLSKVLQMLEETGSARFQIQQNNNGSYRVVVTNRISVQQ